MDISEGNYQDAIIRETTNKVFSIAGKQITNLKNAGIYTKEDAGIMSFLKDSWNQVTNIVYPSD